MKGATQVYPQCIQEDMLMTTVSATKRGKAVAKWGKTTCQKNQENNMPRSRAKGAPKGKGNNKRKRKRTSSKAKEYRRTRIITDGLSSPDALIARQQKGHGHLAR